ncbi:MAG: hypothetical protein JNK82_19470 [Myxococcaceae bacterium]|nr:hypothetical protein [Myxococcaceae bacterium]
MLLLGVLAYEMVQRARRGEREARWFLAGFAVLMAATVRDIAAAFSIISFERDTYVHWGIFGFVLSLGFILQRRWGQTQVELARAKLEREALLRDLHDGIGGVTTNIRLLAELGRRGGGDAAQALESIAQLSGEGMAELRAFMETLDQNAMTWSTLVGELRRYGRQVIESRGQRFAMRDRVEAGGAPSGLFCLGVLRIFREALTNVVKHAGESAVEVEVEVTASGFVLGVHNDGRGASAESAGGGRGLGNMEARARELGGELQVTLENGAHVRLTVPLT